MLNNLILRMAAIATTMAGCFFFAASCGGFELNQQAYDDLKIVYQCGKKNGQTGIGRTNLSCDPNEFVWLRYEDNNELKTCLLDLSQASGTENNSASCQLEAASTKKNKIILIQLPPNWRDLKNENQKTIVPEFIPKFGEDNQTNGDCSIIKGKEGTLRPGNLVLLECRQITSGKITVQAKGMLPLEIAVKESYGLKVYSVNSMQVILPLTFTPENPPEGDFVTFNGEEYKMRDNRITLPTSQLAQGKKENGYKFSYSSRKGDCDVVLPNVSTAKNDLSCTFRYMGKVSTKGFYDTFDLSVAFFQSQDDCVNNNNFLVSRLGGADSLSSEELQINGNKNVFEENAHFKIFNSKTKQSLSGCVKGNKKGGLILFKYEEVFTGDYKLYIVVRDENFSKSNISTHLLSLFSSYNPESSKLFLAVLPEPTNLDLMLLPTVYVEKKPKNMEFFFRDYFLLDEKTSRGTFQGITEIPKFNFASYNRSIADGSARDVVFDVVYLFYVNANTEGLVLDHRYSMFSYWKSLGVKFKFITDDISKCLAFWKNKINLEIQDYQCLNFKTISKEALSGGRPKLSPAFKN